MSTIKIDPEALGLRPDVTAEEIARVLKANLSHNGKGDTPPDPEIEQEAQALLQDPQLVDRFLALVKELGQVGEEANAKLLLIAGVSRMTPAPIALTVKGRSASGKSTLVERCLKIFPPASVHKVTRLTPQALFYLKNKDLRHSILYIAEAPGAQDGDYPLRVMISEGELTLWVPIRKEGEWETQELRIPGPITYLQTTTRAALQPEGETRWFSIWTDEGEPLTRQVLNHLGERISQPQPSLPERKIHIWQTAMGMLAYCPVLVPFAPGVMKALPSRKVRVRRDAARFLAIIEGSALLHQYQRESRKEEGQEFILASREDYKFACSVAGPTLKDSYQEIPDRLVSFLDCLKALPSPIFTRREVQGATKLAASTIRGYLTDLVALGHLEEVIVKGEPLKSYTIIEQESGVVDLPDWEALTPPPHPIPPSTSSTPSPSDRAPDIKGGVEAHFQHPVNTPSQGELLTGVETAIINTPPDRASDRGGGGVDGVEEDKTSEAPGTPPPTPDETSPCPGCGEPTSGLAAGEVCVCCQMVGKDGQG